MLAGHSALTVGEDAGDASGMVVGQLKPDELPTIHADILNAVNGDHDSPLEKDDGCDDDKYGGNEQDD
jgi:hypothetical protein